MPKLLINHPDGSSVKFGLNGTVFTIGRAENNDIVLLDGASSSRHAVLKMTDCGDFAVTDLGSTNHTKVNGHPVDTKVLMNGDVLQFAGTTAIYESDVPAAGRVRDDQQTQAYEQPRPPASKPGMPVIGNQPRSTAGSAAAPAPAAAAPPYVIQRPVSTLGGRRSSSDGGCFTLVFVTLVSLVTFTIGVCARHYRDHEKQWFWDYVRDYITAD